MYTLRKKWYRGLSPSSSASTTFNFERCEGFVRNEKDEYFKVVSGDAVFWEKDEWHETKTGIGLTAIVIESEELIPGLFMPIRI